MNYNKIENTGSRILQYGLATILVYIGFLKFTSYEAAGIQPLVEHSPILSWGYQMMSVQAFAEFLGITEIIAGLLIFCRPLSAKYTAAGGVIGILIFTTTLTLLLSTPGMLQPGYSFPFISPMPGQFVLKDIVLLGASVYTFGKAMKTT